jgi:2-iminobutanoate/2-iminopropanoate deaminase
MTEAFRAVTVPGLSTSPLSAAVVVGDTVHTSGQVGRQPETGVVPAGFEAQMREALANLERVLEAAGSSLERVVKTTVFLARRDDFAAMNAIYAEQFTEPYPARSTIVCALASAELLFEIEALAQLEAPG